MQHKEESDGIKFSGCCWVFFILGSKGAVFFIYKEVRVQWIVIHYWRIVCSVLLLVY